MRVRFYIKMRQVYLVVLLSIMGSDLLAAGNVVIDFANLNEPIELAKSQDNQTHLKIVNAPNEPISCLSSVKKDKVHMTLLLYNQYIEGIFDNKFDLTITDKTFFEITIHHSNAQNFILHCHDKRQKETSELPTINSDTNTIQRHQDLWHTFETALLLFSKKESFDEEMLVQFETRFRALIALLPEDDKRPIIEALLSWMRAGLRSKKTELSVSVRQHVDIIQTPAKSANERIRFLVLHYTAGNLMQSLKILTEGQVSSHYLIPAAPVNGQAVVYQLVDEDRRAWHAGVSTWQSRQNINDSSIGIEIECLGYTDGPNGRIWHPFTEHQIDGLIICAKDIVDRYGILPNRVVGHGDISIGRKVDPGPLFPWKRLAEAGIGAWPKDETIATLEVAQPSHVFDVEGSIDEFITMLNRYGYDASRANLENAIKAFQMHFLPRNVTGELDGETYVTLKALLIDENL